MIPAALVWAAAVPLKSHSQLIPLYNSNRRQTASFASEAGFARLILRCPNDRIPRKDRNAQAAHDAHSGHGDFPLHDDALRGGRESSVRALEEALTGDRKIFLATQHDASIDEPRPKKSIKSGLSAIIVQSVKMPDGNIKVLVEGVERAKSLR